MTNNKIMIVDDESAIRLVLKRMLECQGYDISLCRNGEDCLRNVSSQRPDIILLDLKMPRMDGMAVLNELNSRQVNSKIIIMTAHGSISSAVEAIKLGAYDYITKPFDNDQLLLVIQRAMKHHHTENQLSQAKAQLDAKYKVGGIITEDPRMEKLLERLKRVAPSDASVLITGESGTGKELFARAIHQESNRKDEAFVALNCSAIPSDLIESELFGYKKGAFSGAVSSKEGLVQVADKGTLFLDEVSEMGFQAQAKLLRFVQTGEFYPLGSTETKKVDVRIVSASNRNLKEEIENHNFREDLFFRLNVVDIQIPPLRERKGDIVPLLKFFVKKYKTGDQEILFSQEALDRLLLHKWSGNIRELENVVQSSLLVATGDRVELEDLPISVREEVSVFINDEDSGKLSMLTSEVAGVVEKEAILKALAKHGNNQTKAARELGVSRRTLFRKIKKHNLK